MYLKESESAKVANKEIGGKVYNLGKESRRINANH